MRPHSAHAKNMMAALALVSRAREGSGALAGRVRLAMAAGVAVLPHFVAPDEPALVSVSETVADHGVWLITHPELRRDPKVRVTADFLKRIAAGPRGLC